MPSERPNHERPELGDPSRPAPIVICVDLPDQPTCTVQPGVTRIGRASKNDLCVKEPSVSRFHCCLLRDADGVRVYDSRSSNSTRVGSHAATGQLLADGDTLVLGRCRIVFQAASRPASDHTLAPRVASGRSPPSNGRPAPVRHAEPARATSPVSPSSIAFVVVLASVVIGWSVFSALAPPAEDRTVSRADPVAAPIAPKPAGGDERSEVVRQRGVIARLERELAELRRRLDEGPSLPAATPAAETDDGRAAERERWREHLRQQIEALEDERRELAGQFREALFGEPTSVSEARPRGDAGAEEPEWQVVIEGAERDATPDIARVPRQDLSTKEIRALVKRLEVVLDRYAESGIGPDDLQPDLATLSRATGEHAAEGVLAVFKHAVKLIEEIDADLAFLKKRNEEYLRAARALGSSDAPQEGYGEGRNRAKRQELEISQRRLELSAKKIEIQEGQRARLVLLRDTVLGSLVEFRDESATRFLAAQFALTSDPLRRLAILPALEAAKAMHAIPLLIPKLAHKDEDLAAAVRRTLTALAGTDLGAERAPWEAWWQEHRAEIESDGAFRRESPSLNEEEPRR